MSYVESAAMKARRLRLCGFSCEETPDLEDVLLSGGTHRLSRRISGKLSLVDSKHSQIKVKRERGGGDESGGERQTLSRPNKRWRANTVKADAEEGKESINSPAAVARRLHEKALREAAAAAKHLQSCARTRAKEAARAALWGTFVPATAKAKAKAKAKEGKKVVKKEGKKKQAKEVKEEEEKEEEENDEEKEEEAEEEEKRNEEEEKYEEEEEEEEDEDEEKEEEAEDEEEE